MADEKDNQPVSLEPAILASITVRTIGCNPAVAASLDESDKRHIVLADVFGIVNGLQFGELPNGDQWVGLFGDFRAVNIQSSTDMFNNPMQGRIFKAPVCFLPPGTMEVILTQCRAVGLDEPVSKGGRPGSKIMKPLKDGKTINFAMQLSVMRAKNASGLTYVGQSMIEPSEKDLMSEIVAAAQDVKRRLALAAGVDGEPKQLSAPAGTKAPKR